MAYPITYSADFAEDRNRLTTFFRIFMVIPHFLVLIAYGIAGFFTIVGAWFALVATGRYPQGLYGFNRGLLRYITRLNGYMYLQTDVFPPFGTAADDSYPIRVEVGPPQDQYSRLKTFFKIIVGIPVLVIVYVMQIVYQAVAFISWFWIVVTGQQNRSLQGALNLALGYVAKGTGYLFLLTEAYPPISNDDNSSGAHEAVGSIGAPPTPAPPFSPPSAAQPDRSTLGSDIGLPDLPPPPKREHGDGFSSGDPLR